MEEEKRKDRRGCRALHPHYYREIFFTASNKTDAPTEKKREDRQTGRRRPVPIKIDSRNKCPLNRDGVSSSMSDRSPSPRSRPCFFFFFFFSFADWFNRSERNEQNGFDILNSNEGLNAPVSQLNTPR